jgi:hypothetical protein
MQGNASTGIHKAIGSSTSGAGVCGKTYPSHSNASTHALFEALYRDWLPSGITSEQAVDTLRIPYVPFWSFGERLPAIEEGTSDPASLGFSYQILARLLATRLDWYGALEGQTLAPIPLIYHRFLDVTWLNRHRPLAMFGLTKLGKKGFMELYHFCLDSQINQPHQELLRASRQALVNTPSLPIGAVLDDEENRPKPTAEGIVAQINAINLTGAQRYDYWALTKTGDFYTLMSLSEDDNGENSSINYEIRIRRATEAILHSTNLYKALGTDPNATVQLTIRYGGLQGRSLSSVGETFRGRLNYHEDEVSETVSFRVGVSDSEIVELVQILCEPLFVLFDFASFNRDIYQRIVSYFIVGKAI